MGLPAAEFEQKGHIHSQYALSTHTHPLQNISWGIPTLGSGWAEYSSTYSFRTAEYEKIFALKGLLKRTTTSGNLICTLPVNRRPNSTLVFMTWIYYNATYYPARVDINSSGQVSLIYPTPTVAIGWLNLNGLWFFFT
jgi:hypothetical protein